MKAKCGDDNRTFVPSPLAKRLGFKAVDIKNCHMFDDKMKDGHMFDDKSVARI